MENIKISSANEMAINKVASRHNWKAAEYVEEWAKGEDHIDEKDYHELLAEAIEACCYINNLYKKECYEPMCCVDRGSTLLVHKFYDEAYDPDERLDDGGLRYATFTWIDEYETECGACLV